MDRKWLNFIYDAVMFVIIAGIIIFCLWCIFSCSPKVVTVPEYHTEYVVKTDTFIRYDSIYRGDSVIIRIVSDTVWIEHWRTEYKDRWRDRSVHDTIVKTDSIRVPYPVEKQLSKWQQLKMDAGGYAVFALLVAIVIIFIRNKKP